MLWINMVMDTLAGLAFAFEPPLKKYMDEKPKRKNEPIINKYMLYQIIFMGIFSSMICLFFIKSPLFLSFYRNKQTLMAAFFGLFIFIDIFNSFNARTSNINVFSNILRNKIFLAIMLFIFIIQVIMIYYGGKLFRTSPLNFKEFLLMILWASLVIPSCSAIKIYLRNKNIENGV
jgi:magnesium-transporting ATPase (P-type)